MVAKFYKIAGNIWEIADNCLLYLTVIKNEEQEKEFSPYFGAKFVSGHGFDADNRFVGKRVVICRILW